MSSSFKSFNVMFKKIKFFVIVLLSFNLILSENAFGAIQTSSKCKTINSIKFDSYNIYLCIKQKNKMVWQLQSQPKKISDLNPRTSWFFAKKSIKLKNNSPANFAIIKSDNFNNDSAILIKELLYFASSYFYIKPSQDIIPVFLGTEKDLAFWQRETFNLSPSEGTEHYNRIVSFYNSGGSNTNAASAGRTNANKLYMSFYFGTNVGLSDIKSNLAQTPIHEYVHIVQWSLGGIGDVWAMEGQAEFMGLALSKTKIEDYYSYRNFRISNQLNYGDQRFINTKEKIVNSLYDSSNNSFYSFGTLAWEALTAIHGQTKINQYLDLIRDGMSPQTAFIQSFGYTQKDFLISISGYLLSCRMLLG